MSRNTRLAALALSMLGATMAGLWACQPAVVVPPLDPLPVSLVLSPMLTAIPADGTATTIFISVAEADGTLGTGSVTLAAKQGSLGEEGIVQTSVDLVNGRAIIRYWCDGAKNDKCTGTQRIDGVWGDATANTSITLWPRAATDGGTVGPGPGSDAGGVTPTDHDPGNVYLFGSLTPGTTSTWKAIADFSDPTNADVGFHYDARNPRLGTAGEVFFIEGWKVYRHVRDAFGTTPTPGCWGYTSDVLANDVEVSRPGCTNAWGFLVAPDTGEVLINCFVGDVWLNAAGPVAWLASFGGTAVVALGRNNTALTVRPSPPDSRIVDSTGAVKPVVPTLSNIKFARAKGNGFQVINDNERWTVLADGTATRDGTFALAPGGLGITPTILDGSGIGYGVGGSVIVKFPLAPGVAEIVYDSAATHPVDLCVTPPKVWVQIDYTGSSELITGP
jgi:hypothetical protein